jgi:Ser/Thr protein kinase RdoA (MazF antagonist)
MESRGLQERLEGVVTKLEDAAFAHGDFRANNIMVKPGEEELAVVIDFDRAGKGSG